MASGARLDAQADAAAEQQLASDDAPLVRLIAARLGVGSAALCFDDLSALLRAAFAWVAADDEYCRLYCLAERTEEVVAATEAAARRKRQARSALEPVLSRLGLGRWGGKDARAATKRARQIMKHAPDVDAAPGRPRSPARRHPPRSPPR